MQLMCSMQTCRTHRPAHAAPSLGSLGPFPTDSKCTSSGNKQLLTQQAKWDLNGKAVTATLSRGELTLQLPRTPQAGTLCLNLPGGRVMLDRRALCERGAEGWHPTASGANCGAWRARAQLGLGARLL